MPPRVRNSSQEPLLFHEDGPTVDVDPAVLAELVDHDREETAVEENLNDESLEVTERRAKLPWWKRPSPVWILLSTTLSMLAMTTTIAPRIEIYTILACQVLKPEYTSHMDLRYLGYPFYRPKGLDLPPSPLAINPVLEFVLDSRGMEAWTTPVQRDRHNDKASNLCSTDPAVQAAVAKLTATLSTTLGILSCLTAAWWGSFSDRFGRTTVIGLALVGQIIADANFIFVSFFVRRLPGGYWFLIVGSLADGLVGGSTVVSAAGHAYISDCTTPAERSRVFSLSLGLMFTGLAIGPTLGSILIRITGQTLSVFYLALLTHLFVAAMVWLFVPESLSLKKKVRAQLAHREAKIAESPSRTVARRVKNLFGFLAPLAIFYPATVIDAIGRTKKDWNLTLIALSYALTITAMGSYAYLFQYATAQFGWTSEIIGYWLGSVGVTRALYLAVLLPIVIKYFKTSHQPSSAERRSRSPPRSETQPLLKSPPTDNLAFDLALARVSNSVDVVSHAVMTFTLAPLGFTLASMCGALSAGFSPALQALALELYIRRGGTETGRLFGALSVITSLGGSVIGPPLYGFLYVQTVAVFPQALLLCVTLVAVLSGIALSFVRVPKHMKNPNNNDFASGGDPDSRGRRNATLVDDTTDEDPERGRGIQTTGSGYGRI